MLLMFDFVVRLDLLSNIMADLINLTAFFTSLSYLHWRRSFCSYTYFEKYLNFGGFSICS